MSDPIYQDAGGEQIFRGDRVSVAGDSSAAGTIVAIYDPDGEPDSETGIMRGIAPKLEVKWDEYEGSEMFYFHWLAKGPWDENAPYECDEIEKVMNP